MWRIAFFLFVPHLSMSEAQAQTQTQTQTHTPTPPPAQADKDKDIDELEDFEDSEDEDPTQFRVRDPLNPPTANLFSTQALHSTLCLDLTYTYNNWL
jgi:hypothetical protein